MHGSHDHPSARCARCATKCERTRERKWKQHNSISEQWLALRQNQILLHSLRSHFALVSTISPACIHDLLERIIMITWRTCVLKRCGFKSRLVANLSLDALPVIQRSHRQHEHSSLSPLSRTIDEQPNFRARNLRPKHSTRLTHTRDVTRRDRRRRRARAETGDYTAPDEKRESRENRRSRTKTATNRGGAIFPRLRGRDINVNFRGGMRLPNVRKGMTKQHEPHDASARDGLTSDSRDPRSPTRRSPSPYACLPLPLPLPAAALPATDRFALLAPRATPRKAGIRSKRRILERKFLSVASFSLIHLACIYIYI